MTAPTRPRTDLTVATTLTAATTLLPPPTDLRRPGTGAEDLARHESRLGRCPVPGGSLLDLLTTSGLTGHGGAHVPVAARWRTAIAAGPPAVVVANGAESEPLSRKDHVLLTTVPHLVLDGLQLVGEALAALTGERAPELVLWLHDDAGSARHAVHAALGQRLQAGWTGGGPNVRIQTTTRHYLSGESSAVTAGVLGWPVLPAWRGAAGRRYPVLVHNVETLARIALLARTGAVHPTRLVTVATPGGSIVVEAQAGSTVSDILAAGDAPDAVLLGGFGGGTWLPGPAAVAQPLVAGGAADDVVGAGLVAPLPHGACGLATTARVLGYLAAMGARQCGPCMFGLPSLAADMEALLAGRRRSAQRLLRTAALVDGRGACHHPDGAVRVMATALTTFADDVRQHERRGQCLSGGGQPAAWAPSRTAA